MANYTEQVESHNPALTASGLAVWGWILRITVALSFLVLPYVITTSTMLVDNQTAATALQAIEAAQRVRPRGRYAPPAAPATVITGLRATGQAGPQTLATILEGCNTTHNLLKALGAAGGLSNPQVQGLLAFNPLATAIEQGKPVTQAQIHSVALSPQDLANLLVAEQKLVPAQKTSPNEWKRWWTVCLIGSWSSPSWCSPCGGGGARGRPADLAEHERLVAAELDKLRGQMPLQQVPCPMLAPTGTEDGPLWVR